MRPIQDAYGEQLLAEYNKKGEQAEIIERDDMYIGTGSEPGTYFKVYKHWPPTQKKAIALVKGRVLDVGAGAGRHSLYLQKNGLDVTAIDNSPGAAKVCRLRGIKKAKVVPIEKISTFQAASFDTIIMFGHNFGLFGNPRKAKALLRKMHAITSPKAQILAETKDPYKTKTDDHLAYHVLNRKRGRMPGQIRMRVRFAKAIGPWFDYLFVSQQEMGEIVKNTGWIIKRFITGKKNASYVAVLAKE